LSPSHDRERPNDPELTTLSEELIQEY
jgi:hypothetical protein